jgi:hypothetical protein
MKEKAWRLKAPARDRRELRWNNSVCSIRSLLHPTFGRMEIKLARPLLEHFTGTVVAYAAHVL